MKGARAVTARAFFFQPDQVAGRTIHLLRLMPHRLEIDYAKELARAAGGAVLFAFPLLMTMEMWWLGFHMERSRLALFVAFGMLLLFGLSRRVGFSSHSRWFDDICDALSAYGVGAVVAALLLLLFNVLQPAMSVDEWIGKIAIQSVPAGMGAILARVQFAQPDGGEEKTDRPPTYVGELFLMVAGAVYVAFNVAPTDEIEQIAQLMTPWHGIVLALLSVGLLHLFVYTLGFAGQEEWPQEHGFLTVFTRFSLSGYALALAVSFYILWTFGRIDGTGTTEIAMMVVVLGFPSSIGTATARLIV